MKKEKTKFLNINNKKRVVIVNNEKQDREGEKTKGRSRPLRILAYETSSVERQKWQNNTLRG